MKIYYIAVNDYDTGECGMVVVANSEAEAREISKLYGFTGCEYEELEEIDITKRGYYKHTGWRDRSIKFTEVGD